MRIPLRCMTAVAVVLLLTVLFPIHVTDASDATGLEHSDEYYYNQMGDNDRALYRAIYAAAVNFETDIDSGYTDWDVGTDSRRGLYVLECVRFDHPELFHLMNLLSYYRDGRITLSFSMNESEYRDAKEDIDDYISTLGISGATRKALVDSINAAIVNNTVYDDAAAAYSGDDHHLYYYAHCIEGVFLENKAVCEGYGLAFKYLCDMYSIPCICVEGHTDEGEDHGHLWNYVQMGSKWYAMDVTWNDNGYNTSAYSLVGSDTLCGSPPKVFKTTHINGKVTEYFAVPAIENEKYLVPIGDESWFDYSYPYEQHPFTYYRDKLTANGQKAYDSIVKGVVGYYDEVMTGVIGDEYAFYDAITAIRLDRQDLFCMDVSSTIYYPSSGKVELGYAMSETEYRELRDDTLESLIPLGKELMGISTVYDRVLTIHDYIVLHTKYQKTDHAWDIYGCLSDGRCVCEGYSRTFQYVCAQYGIDVICVRGTGNTSDGSENHMWNLVHMNDGRWYSMDVTWDDPLVDGSDSGEVYYDYYLVGTETKNSDGMKFSESHVPVMAPEDGKTHVFDNSILPEAYARDYFIRPEYPDEFIIASTVTETDGVYTATVGITDLQNIAVYMQGNGTAVVMFGEGIGTKIGVSASDLDDLIEYMGDYFLTEFSFVSKVETGKVKIGPLEVDNDIYTFGMTDGTGEVKQSDISSGFRMIMYVPYSPGALDFIHSLIKSWDAENLKPVSGSAYDSGFVSFTSEDTEAGYVVGSTPVKGVTAFMVIMVLALLILVVILLIRRRRRKKRMKANRAVRKKA